MHIDLEYNSLDLLETSYIRITVREHEDKHQTGECNTGHKYSGVYLQVVSHS
jgi:hypothetical protein